MTLKERLVDHPLVTVRLQVLCRIGSRFSLCQRVRWGWMLEALPLAKISWTVIAGFVLSLAMAQPQSGALVLNLNSDGLQPLEVGPSARHFIAGDKNVFLVADTAWSLFFTPTMAEIEEYLKKRSEQGFNAVLATVLWEYDWEGPNVNGQRSFEYLNPSAANERLKGRDVSRPGEAYFKYIDRIVDRANALGIHVGLLPAWNNHLGGPGGWRVPLAFTPEKARQYGRYLAQRYKDQAVFWVLGGDDPLNEQCDQGLNPCTTAKERVPLWDAMAQGIREASQQLITFHPGGTIGTAQKYFANKSWLSFHGQQSGHDNRYFLSKIYTDYGLLPARPVVDLEPLYEDHPVAGGYSSASDVRRILYWNVFSGAGGVGYGHHSVWQFYAPPRPARNNPIKTWREALNAPGVTYLQHLKALMESRPFWETIPTLNILSDGMGKDLETVRALKSKHYGMIYFPKNRSFTLNLNALNEAPGPFALWWFDPRSGQVTQVGEFAKGVHNLSTPSASGDWVLVIDNKSSGFGPPGKK